MAVSPLLPPQDEYCSTSAAALLLGVSPGTVQQMVESGLLDAWKTTGGHRRIRVASIHDYLTHQGRPLPRSGASDIPHLRVLIAEAEPVYQTLYRDTLESWSLPLNLVQVDNGVDALLEIGRQMPDLLIVDATLPAVDGLDMVRRLRTNPTLAPMDIIAVSDRPREEVMARGELPTDVTLYGKPIPFHELHGYIQARITQLRKAAGA